MKLLLLAVTLMLFFSASATNIYLSATSGDDNRSFQQAQHPSTPWKTIQKLNSMFGLLQPGDSVLFKRGETFYGRLVVTKSGTAGNPIVIASFGTGDKPVITGFTTLTGFRNESGKIWVQNLNAVHPHLLLLNEQLQPLGRYPNATEANGGYLTYEASTGSSITDNELATSTNWTGAELVIRKNRWIIDRSTITAQNNKSLFYTNPSTYNPTAGFGYFIQNSIKTLDKHGEWYFDPTQKKLSVYLDSYGPGTSIKVSTMDSLVAINNQRFLTIHGLHLDGANENAITINDANDVKVSDCEVTHAGFRGVFISNSSDITIERSSFRHASNNAIETNYFCTNITIDHNNISHTGLFAGMGHSGDLAYHAIITIGKNNRTSNNRIDSTGYIPIRFEGDSNTVQNNFITNFLLVKDDGGGIYTWNNNPNAPEHTGRVIKNNLIRNGIGAGAGTNNPSRLFAHGIYMDDNSSGVEILGNSVLNCTESGLYIHNARKIKAHGNTLYNNGSQLYLQHDRVSSNNPIREVELRNNIFFSRTPAQLLLNIRTIRDDIAQFGTSDNNYFCRPLSEKPFIQTTYVKGNEEYSLAYDLDGWKASQQKDLASKGTPVQLPAYHMNGLQGANKIANAGFDKNIDGVLGFTYWGKHQLGWNQNGRLDNGSLDLSFDSSRSNRAYVLIPVGQVTAGKTYILQYSLLGTGRDKSMSLFLRRTTTPTTRISDIAWSRVTNFRTENTFLFVPTATEAAATLAFDISDQNRLWLDNVHFSEATVSMSQPDDYFLVASNDLATVKTVLLDQPYVDAQNKTYTGSINIEPFSAVVLIKKSLQPGTTQAIDLVGEKKGAGVQLYWHTASFTNGNLFQIERSVDGQSFNPIAYLPVEQANQKEYTFYDSLPGSQLMVHYRIRQVQQDNSSFTSNPVHIELNLAGAIVVYPNPVHSQLYVVVKNIADGSIIRLFNAAGAQINSYSLPVNSTSVPISVDHLATGLYYVSFGNETVPFLKVQ